MRNPFASQAGTAASEPVRSLYAVRVHGLAPVGLWHNAHDDESRVLCIGRFCFKNANSSNRISGKW